MNNIVVSDNIKIENMIYEIRGKQVMLDSDLAKLYGCKNGTRINIIKNKVLILNIYLMYLLNKE